MLLIFCLWFRLLNRSRLIKLRTTLLNSLREQIVGVVKALTIQEVLGV